MEKMEFIYTIGWDKFEQYCKELYRGYLNRYCQGNEKACEDEINKAYAMGMNFIREKVKENKEILKQLWVAAFICKLCLNGMPVPLLRNCYSIFNGTKYR